jgi:hypothetical protein
MFRPKQLVERTFAEAKKPFAAKPNSSIVAQNHFVAWFLLYIMFPIGRKRPYRRLNSRVQRGKGFFV